VIRLNFMLDRVRYLQAGIDFGPRPGLRNDTVSILSPHETFVSSISSGITKERSLRSVRIPERNQVLARFLGMLAAESSNEKLFIQVRQQKVSPKKISVLRNSNFFRESARGTGYMNEGDALLTANRLQRLLQFNEGLEAADISVITPYVEEKRDILDKLRVNSYGPAE
jgi:hypothetical protein